MVRFVLIYFMAYCFCNLILASSHAFELPSFSGETYETKDKRAQKYLDFVKKDGRCDMAIAVVPRSSGTSVMKALREKFPSAIRCMGYVTLSPDTIQEVSGCAAFLLSPANKDFFPLVPRSYGGGMNMVQKKKCEVGFKELLNQGPIVGDSRVNEYLSGARGFDIPSGELSGGRGSDYEAETVLLYSKKKLYTDWYFKEKKKNEETLKAEYPKRNFNPMGAKNEIPKKPVADEVIP